MAATAYPSGVFHSPRASTLVLFRTRLEWCNYTCHYCPWNAERQRVSGEEFQDDERRLFRIIDRVSELSAPVEFFITPKAEYLVLPYWRRAVGALLSLPQVERVTVQTNLSFDVQEFLDQVDASRLALWTTYHPSEVGEQEFEGLCARWSLLEERGVPFSVGIVGTQENLPAMHALRQRLSPSTYLWVNAYKREADYYTGEQLEQIRSVDPFFDLNNQHFPSRGKPCTAGQRAVYLDDEGDLRRCFFVGRVIGNLFRDGWRTLDAPLACPRETCHCYVGQMHIVELDFRSIYGKNLAVRIPNNWEAIQSSGEEETRARVT